MSVNNNKVLFDPQNPYDSIEYTINHIAHLSPSDNKKFSNEILIHFTTAAFFGSRKTPPDEFASALKNFQHAVEDSPKLTLLFMSIFEVSRRSYPLINNRAYYIIETPDDAFKGCIPSNYLNPSKINRVADHEKNTLKLPFGSPRLLLAIQRWYLSSNQSFNDLNDSDIALLRAFANEYGNSDFQKELLSLKPSVEYIEGNLEEESNCKWFDQTSPELSIQRFTERCTLLPREHQQEFFRAVNWFFYQQAFSDKKTTFTFSFKLRFYHLDLPFLLESAPFTERSKWLFILHVQKVMGVCHTYLNPKDRYYPIVYRPSSVQTAIDNPVASSSDSAPSQDCRKTHSQLSLDEVTWSRFIVPANKTIVEENPLVIPFLHPFENETLGFTNEEELVEMLVYALDSGVSSWIKRASDTFYQSEKSAKSTERLDTALAKYITRPGIQKLVTRIINPKIDGLDEIQLCHLFLVNYRIIHEQYLLFNKICKFLNEYNKNKVQFEYYSISQTRSYLSYFQALGLHAENNPQFLRVCPNRESLRLIENFFHCRDFERRLTKKEVERIKNNISFGSALESHFNKNNYIDETIFCLLKIKEILSDKPVMSECYFNYLLDLHNNWGRKQISETGAREIYNKLEQLEIQNIFNKYGAGEELKILIDKIVNGSRYISIDNFSQRFWDVFKDQLERIPHSSEGFFKLEICRYWNSTDPEVIYPYYKLFSDQGVYDWAEKNGFLDVIKKFTSSFAKKEYDHNSLIELRDIYNLYLSQDMTYWREVREFFLEILREKKNEEFSVHDIYLNTTGNSRKKIKTFLNKSNGNQNHLSENHTYNIALNYMKKRGELKSRIYKLNESSKFFFNERIKEHYQARDHSKIEKLFKAILVDFYLGSFSAIFPRNATNSLNFNRDNQNSLGNSSSAPSSSKDSDPPARTSDHFSRHKLRSISLNRYLENYEENHLIGLLHALESHSTKMVIEGWTASEVAQGIIYGINYPYHTESSISSSEKPSVTKNTDESSPDLSLPFNKTLQLFRELRKLYPNNEKEICYLNWVFKRTYSNDLIARGRELFKINHENDRVIVAMLRDQRLDEFASKEWLAIKETYTRPHTWTDWFLDMFTKDPIRYFEPQTQSSSVFDDLLGLFDKDKKHK